MLMPPPGARAGLLDMEAVVRARYLNPQASWFRGPPPHDLWWEYVHDGYTGQSLAQGLDQGRVGIGDAPDSAP